MFMDQGCRIWSCRILINSQYVVNRHANKQLVNSEIRPAFKL